jgi:hypothetical protein
MRLDLFVHASVTVKADWKHREGTELSGSGKLTELFICPDAVAQ